MINYDFSGQTAIITGAAQGLGLTIAKQLHDAGGNVVLWDIDPVAIDGAASQFSGQRHLISVLDVTDADAVHDALRSAVERFESVEILFNNAGIVGPIAALWEYPLEEWRRVIETDLTGVFICCRSVIPCMLKTGYGRIVNVASITGKEGNPRQAAYSSAKAGVIALTKSLGEELAQTGIRVNAVAPAMLETRLLDQMSEETHAYVLSKIPMGRFGKTEEVAALCLWLASRACSFSTGAVFDASGGRATY